MAIFAIACIILLVVNARYNLHLEQMSGTKLTLGNYLYWVAKGHLYFYRVAGWQIRCLWHKLRGAELTEMPTI